MSEQCVLCRHSPAGSKEHIVPKSLGGWLTTRHVCDGCNHRLGTEVDSVVANYSVLLLLREEAGVAPARGVEGTYYNPDLGIDESVRRMAGGEVQFVQRVQEVGSRVYIRGPDIPHVDREAARLTGRYERAGRTVTSTAARMEGRRAVMVHSRQSQSQLERFRAALGREAAKIAVEYVAAIGGPDVALQKELDSLRSHALDGIGLAVPVLVSAIKPTQFWLPRVQQVVTLAPHGPVRWVDRDVAAMTPEQIPAPLGVPHRTRLVHRLRVWRDREGGHFGLDLFDCVRATLDLPADLPIPWERTDWRQFHPRKHGTCYG